MKMKAKDSFHVSSLGEVVHAGQEFEVHNALGKELEAKGHATRVGGSDSDAGVDQVEATEADLEPENKEAELEALSAAKAVPAPENKMEEAPVNKKGPGRPKKAPEGEAE